MNFVREAGWPIFLVLVPGLLSLLVASSYAGRPSPGKRALLIGLSLSTVMAGCLGTVLGIQLTVHAASEVAAAERWIFLVGLKESLNNLVAALVLSGTATLAATIGSYRAAREEKIDVPVA